MIGQRTPFDDDEAHAAKSLLRVLDAGRRTGTHKLVTLLALMATVERRIGATGTVPEAVPVREVADEVVDLLWQQVAPFVPFDGAQPRRLLQMKPNGKGSNALVDICLEARRDAERLAVPTWSALGVRDPVLVQGLQDRLVRALVKNPLARLQVLDGQLVEFLYRWPWGSDRSPKSVATAQRRPEVCVEFAPDAGRWLLEFAPLVRPLVESLFVADVARYNGLDRAGQALTDHLFGADRVAFPPELRKRLHEQQNGRCFYEPDGPVVPRATMVVDHFIPWARHPNHAVENLVLAHRSCNTSKSDLFAAPDHLLRWAAGLGERQSIGREVGETSTVVFSDLARSMGIARRGYQLLPDGLPLWMGVDGRRRVTVPLQRDGRSSIERRLAELIASRGASG